VTEVRVGIGLDAHAFVEGGRLRLGGIDVDSPRGLAGHSDGDVISHALIDALLGAAGLGDIGELFPSDDPQWEGASSLDLLSRAFAVVRDSGFELMNADCVLVGEEPRLAPYREAMRASLADCLGVTRDRITVRATTTDRLGFTGRREGLAAQAVALVRRSDAP
jgi:2-C-methyl-D-erythritol 2,4-cyclodiphosphate synthase